MALALRTTAYVLDTMLHSAPIIPQAIRLVFFDIETTGLNPYHDHIIEIAVSDNYGAEYQSLVKPPVTLSPKITELTGLTDADLKDAPEPIAVAQKFSEFLETPPNTTLVMIGHNSISFDCRFLKSWLNRVNVPCDNFRSCYHVDTMRLAQYYYPKRYSYALSSLMKYAGLTAEGGVAHRAMADVQSTKCLFNHIISEIRRVKGTSILDICVPTMD